MSLQFCFICMISYNHLTKLYKIYTYFIKFLITVTIIIFYTECYKYTFIERSHLWKQMITADFYGDC